MKERERLGKGCGALYLQRTCHGAGHEAILGEISVRKRIKQAGGKPGFLPPELRRPKAPLSDHKKSLDQLLLLALAAEKDNFLNSLMETA